MIARGRPEHPAVEAWRKLQPASAGPESIQVLRERMSSATYRLIGVVPGDSPVIAQATSGTRRRTKSSARSRGDGWG